MPAGAVLLSVAVSLPLAAVGSRVNVRIGNVAVEPAVMNTVSGALPMRKPNKADSDEALVVVDDEELDDVDVVDGLEELGVVLIAR